VTRAPAATDTDLSSGAARRRLLVLVAALVVLGVTAVRSGPDVATVQAWVEATGWVAPVAFTLLYAALTVALVPASVLTLAAGLLFGGILGATVTLVGATAGAIIAFSVARMGGRRAVERLAAGRLAQVDAWLGQRGLAAVITLRLVPLVPFSAANYAAGLTAIRGRDFAVGTAVGIVPGVLVYTSLGASLTDPTGPAFLAAVAALLALSLAGSIALRRSRRARPRVPAAAASESGSRRQAVRP
jgi:uncharacterized membrane protein YdjX (TVP38/TMEM64 family)